MADIKTNLRVISKEYTIFEEDQVLTHEQLNGAIEYLNDQQRLTRVDLAGVGIYCGLRVSVPNPMPASPTVRVTAGVGVTTDGDLAHVPSELAFTHYKRYDDTAPHYDKLVPGGSPLRTWELLASTTTDLRAAPLSGFAAAEGVALSTLSVLLLVESVDVDQDICSPTDCDSRGDTAMDTVRVLLVDAAAAVTHDLAGVIPTPDVASRVLIDVVPSRPLLTGILDIAGLTEAYRGACSTMHAALITALPALHTHAGAFLWETDPTAAWVTKLQTLSTASAVGLQYYYDYLKDIVETYGELRAQLALDTVVCTPNLDAFPKHLLLGPLVAGTGADVRTGFYPSPLIRGAVDRLGHARFLARKLGTLILSFRLPSTSGITAADGIRITPSHWGDRPLEERAIPYYYDPTFTPAPHDTWRFDYTLRGMSRHNHGYHARSYGGEGEAARPLASNLGRHDFFRVEGHLGRPVNEVMATLESAIRRNNVPITLATGLIRATSVVSGEVESDVLETYNLVREQLALLIEQVLIAGRSLFARLGTRGTFNWPYMEQLTLRAPVALEGLRAPWEEAHANLGWRSAINDVIAIAGELSIRLHGELTVAQQIAFTAILSTTLRASIDELHAQMLGEETVAGMRPLFVSHLQQQPGLEHFAGAARGATLLLVYDESERVIADFMLPCCNCEVVAEADQDAAGAREPVSGVYAKQGSSHDRQLLRGAELSGDRLAEGLRITPQTDVEFERATDADCTVTIEAPFPQTVDDVDIVGGAGIGYQPVVLAGKVSTHAGDLFWTPVDRTARWLRHKLPELLGRPRIDFYSGNDEGNKVGWRFGAQHQLSYSETSERELQSGQPIIGGAAVFKRPTSGGQITMRVYWPSTIGTRKRQVGLIYGWTGPRDFSILLYEAIFGYGGGGGGFGGFIYFNHDVTLVRVANGVASYGQTERVASHSNVDLSQPHPPIQLVVSEDGFEISDATGSNYIPTYTSPKKLDVAGTRIGAFTTSPVQIWELSDEVQALQPLYEARLRARLHVDRDCATWNGPPGMKRPFLPDHDTWFWLRVGWPSSYGSGYARPLYGYGLHEEYPGIGAELIQ